MSIQRSIEAMIFAQVLEPLMSADGAAKTPSSPALRIVSHTKQAKNAVFDETNERFVMQSSYDEESEDATVSVTLAGNLENFGMTAMHAPSTA